MHLLGEIGRDDAFLELLDHPAVFPVIWSELGWNIHLYHCHLDVTPPREQPRPPAWGWHQDGGRQNLELDSDPRPRMSLEVAFWLSDVSARDRGNMLSFPAATSATASPGPSVQRSGSTRPAARSRLASAGDALIFDRRLWHSRSDNLSQHTRPVIFLAYSYHWVRRRDDFGIDPSSERFRRLSPVRRQLLGEPAGRHHQWGLERDAVPLQERSRAAACWIPPCRASDSGLYRFKRMTPTIEVLDQGRRIAFSVEDMMRYHGPGSPGGVAHAFKVLELALPLLDPDGPCERREIVVKTAFGGRGARDAFSLPRVITGGPMVDNSLACPERGRRSSASYLAELSGERCDARPAGRLRDGRVHRPGPHRASAPQTRSAGSTCSSGRWPSACWRGQQARYTRSAGPWQTDGSWAVREASG